MQRERDGVNFVLPSLGTMCIHVAAKHFLTHVLPSRETYDAVQGKVSKTGRFTDKGKSKAPAARQSRGRVVSRGIGGRPIMDEESAAGADYRPRGSDDSDSDAGPSNIGIAAAPRSMRNRPPSQSTKTGPLPDGTTTEDLTVLSQENHQILRVLPEHTLLRLLKLLRVHSPDALTRHILTTYFVVGKSDVELDASMKLFVDYPTSANLIIKSAGPNPSMAQPSPDSPTWTPPLTRLSLSGLTRLDPIALASLFRRCHHLEEVVLKGCVRVDSDCMAALVGADTRRESNTSNGTGPSSSAKTLRHLNLNFTDVGAAGVEAVLGHCPNLSVLKLANVLGLSDKTVPEMIRRATTQAASSPTPFLPLGRLKSLKLKATTCGPVAISSFVQLCTSTLQRLDLAGLNLLTAHGMATLASVLGVEVSSTSRAVAAPELPTSARRPHLVKLNLSDNVSGTSRLHDYEIAIPVMMRLIPAFAETLEVLLLDDLDIDISAFDLLQREMSCKYQSIAAQAASDGIAWHPPLKRLSLANAYPTVLEQQDLWLTEDEASSGSIVAPSTQTFWLKTIVEELNLSGIDLRQSNFAKLVSSSRIPYNTPDHVAGHEVVGTDAYESELASSVRLWPRMKKLDLSNTSIGDHELLCFSQRLLCQPYGVSGGPTQQQQHTLRELVLAGTSVTSDGVKEAVRRAGKFTERVDLTGCRGVGIRERRGFWESVEGEEEHEVAKVTSKESAKSTTSRRK